MDHEARQQFGLLLTDHEKLLDILASSVDMLEDYPELRAFLVEKNEQSVSFRTAIRKKTFSKDDYRDEILARLDTLGYDICTSNGFDMDFIINHVASICGDDIGKIQSLNVKQLNASNLSKLLHMMSLAVYAEVDDKPNEFPFLSIRGQANVKFWRKLDEVHIAYINGYSTHWKLNSWCKDSLGLSCPQSAIRFFKRYGDPSDVIEWVEWKKAKDKSR
ncbi:hypothetical protein [Vibrio hippocampi]|uniref:DUF2857 domain-containing protein n=1 Tax=Vibrio hippocampi TaxID=654686 RepID=A0ABM8ZGJ9_9VIBR|nr:hypothetical protein [Vibrio hippocampi]CAH0525505.1 hypothetical protein VHP8226_01030 [Vibrio hippocampi]